MFGDESKGLKFKAQLVSKMILVLREKGKIRTVPILWSKCDEINFGHFPLELPMGHASGNAH